MKIWGGNSGQRGEPQGEGIGALTREWITSEWTAVDLTERCPRVQTSFSLDHGGKQSGLGPPRAVAFFQSGAQLYGRPWQFSWSSTAGPQDEGSGDH